MKPGNYGSVRIEYSPLQGVTGVSNGTHTHTLVGRAGVLPGAVSRARLRGAEATGGEPQRG